MEDAEYGGDDGDYFFEDDWLYIEDEVAFADELAETQIPSPGYSGTNAELMLEWYEYDTYEYFGELEYGSDVYWDTTIRERQVQEQTQSGNQSPRKRRRLSTTSNITGKRRKVDEAHHKQAYSADLVNVVYRKYEPAKIAPTLPSDAQSFALFSDWRERFRDADVIWKKSMPEDMKRAAQPHGIETTDSQPVEVELDDEAPEQAESLQDLLSSLDPAALRAVLKSKLGNAGMDEEAFMHVISNMLSGGTADSAAEQLAHTLLGGEEEQKEGALNWLQDQGMQIDLHEDDTQAGARNDSAAGLSTETTRALPDAELSEATPTRPNKKRARPKR